MKCVCVSSVCVCICVCGGVLCGWVDGGVWMGVCVEQSKEEESAIGFQSPVKYAKLSQDEE